MNNEQAERLIKAVQDIAFLAGLISGSVMLVAIVFVAKNV